MTPDSRTRETHVAERACPGAEALSCFIDGELPGERAEAVSTHVSQCLECADVLGHMQSLRNQPRADAGSRGCPDRETLAAYLISGLGADEQHGVDAHVSTCNACVRVLARTHRQLRGSWTLATPIAPALVARAMTVARQGMNRPLSLRPCRVQPPVRVPAYLRLPVLMPTAFAAGAAFFIALNAANLVPRGRVDQTRAAGAFTANRRVTAAETLMRSEPHDTATVVARVARGLAVEVQEEQPEWLLVSLPTHEQGWVPRRAFE